MWSLKPITYTSNSIQNKKARQWTKLPGLEEAFRIVEGENLLHSLHSDWFLPIGVLPLSAFYNTAGPAYQARNVEAPLLPLELWPAPIVPEVA